MKTSYQTYQKLKSYYIPLVASGRISIRKAAKKIGITSQTVFILKHKYLKEGHKAFINGHKGLIYQPKKYSDSFRNQIINLYNDFWKDSPFSSFRENLEKYHNIVIKYNTLRSIMKKAKIKPPRSWSTKEKQEHKTRDERYCEGELVQMDGSTHDWFMNGKLETLHGGIDDATHSITGLYMCLNECRLGYNEVLRQTWTNYGIPKAYYIDRHSSFVKAGKKKQTLSEKLNFSKNESTHFTDLCNDLNIEVILALSPQGKGRIERLWQTLQGKLPFIFRFLKIDTIDKANNFLSEWIKDFNEKYSVPPRNALKVWKTLPDISLDYKLSLKFSCHTDSMGYFSFHDCDFRLVAPFKACKNFELCLSEKFGLLAYMDNSWYKVELAEKYLMTTYADRMPIVEKDLISRFLVNDLRSLYA